MRRRRDKAMLWIHAKTLLEWPVWWRRLVVLFGMTCLVFWWLVGSSESIPGMSRLIAEIGAAVLVLWVIVGGPPAARGSVEAFGLSRPIGRADEVNRRALVAAVVALVSSLVIGVVGYAWAPALFRSQLAEVSWTSWYSERLNPLYGVDVVLDSAEDRTCFDKWYAARWGGSSECNDSAGNGFSAFSGEKKKTFVFASAHERDCLARASSAVLHALHADGAGNPR